MGLRIVRSSHASIRTFTSSSQVLFQNTRLYFEEINLVESIKREILQNSSESKESTKSVKVEENEDPAVITMKKFLADSAFDRNVRTAVKNLRFEEFTPVQQRALIPFLNENGVVCKAKTGTGKTYSFVIPLLARCMEEVRNPTGKRVIGLVIAPTRDLARQIYEDIVKLTDSNNELRSKTCAALWCGGMQRTVQSHRRLMPQIVVGTPGRVLDNLRSSRWGPEFKNLEYRVFDEADRLLDQGFETELIAIDDAIKDVRNPSAKPLKNTLFSATVDDRVVDFARLQIGEDFKYINCVSKDENMSHLAIEQELIHTQSLHDSVSAAINHMVKMSETDSKYKAIFFLPTKVFVESCFEIWKNLKDSRGIWRLHGDMSQASRDRTTANFKKARRGILICTDVAARGMDYKNITEVVQVGLSREPADYIHKIGRTGRAGASGTAKLFLATHELPFADLLVKKMGIDFAKRTELDPATVELIFDNTSVHPEDVESQIMSLIGAQKSLADTYNLNKHAAMKDVVDLYRVMMGDMSRKLFMRVDRFNKIGMPSSLVPDHIEVDDENRLKRPRGNNRGMRQQFSRNTRGGYNDRFRDRDDNNSYGNRNYGGYNNRRNDRFSEFRNDNQGRSRRSSYEDLRELDGYTGGQKSKRSFR